MKRILSWIVLYLITVVIELLTSVVVGLGGYVLGLVGELNTFLRLIIYLVGGTTFLSFLFLPTYYGFIFVIFASEAIKKSKKGMRYTVFGIYCLIAEIVFIINGLASHTFLLSNLILSIIMCIFYIALIVAGATTAKENANDNDKIAPNNFEKMGESHIRNQTCEENEWSDITDYEVPTAKEIQQIDKEIRATSFVTFNLLSISGHTKEIWEVTDKNKAIVDKWLDKETNALYCLEKFENGTPQYYYTTKEIFDSVKEKFF